MKRLIAVTISVLTVSVLVCLGSLLSLDALLERAHGMAMDVRVYWESGEEDAARE